MTYKLADLPSKFNEIEAQIRSIMPPPEVTQSQQGGKTPRGVDPGQSKRFFGSSTPRKRGGKK